MKGSICVGDIGRDPELNRRQKTMLEGFSAGGGGGVNGVFGRDSEKQKMMAEGLRAGVLGVLGMNPEFNRKQKMMMESFSAGGGGGVNGRDSELTKKQKMMAEGLRAGGNGVNCVNAEFKRLNLGIQQNNNNNNPLLKRLGCRVMIIDDNGSTHVHDLFLQLGCLVHASTEPSKTLSSLKQNKNMVDFVICNIHMKGMDEATLFELVGLKDVLVIMMSTYMDMRLVTEGMNHGASSFILKPQSFDDIENISSFVLEKKKYSSWFPWNLYYKFDQVVNQLGGLDEAVPEKILELMNAENIIIPLQVIEERLKVLREFIELRGTKKEVGRFNVPPSGCRLGASIAVLPAFE